MLHQAAIWGQNMHTILVQLLNEANEANED